MQCAAFAPHEFDGQESSTAAAGIRRATQISPHLFSVLGISPLIGRAFTAADESPTEILPALLGYELWVNRFSSRTDVIGRDWEVGRNRFRIVGVMPPAIDFPRGTNFWTPLTRNSQRENFGYLTAVVRLEGEDDRRIAASAEALSIVEATARDGTRLRAVRFTSLRETLKPDEGSSLLVLIVGSTLVFLITWVHVSGIQLSRMLERAAELHLRVALGSTRTGLLRQCIIEACLLAGSAILLSFLLVRPTADLLMRLLPHEISAGQVITPDWRVFVFGSLLALVGVSILCLAPAASLGELSARSPIRVLLPTTHVFARRLRASLLVMQLGLSVALSYSALSLVHQFLRLSNLDLGFNPTNLTAVSFAPLLEPGKDQSRYYAYMSQLINAMEGIPGIERVAAANVRPLSPGTFLVEVRGPDGNGRDTSSMRWVTADYFATVGQGLVTGRMFTSDDREESQPVAIVNRVLEQRFGRRDIVGSRISVFGLPRTIVGVVDDALEQGPATAAAPQLYIPAFQFAPAATLLVRSQLPVIRVEESVRHALRGITTELGEPVTESIEHLVTESLSLHRARSALLSILSVVALSLTLIGIYGSVRNTIIARTRELAVRIALGATPKAITLTISREVVALTIFGTALGLIVGLGFTRLFGSVFFALPDVDLIALAIGTVVFFVGATAATVGCARRAVSINPADALRRT
jgi:predicted permease